MRGCRLILSNLKPSTAVNNSEKSFLMYFSCPRYGIPSPALYLPSTAFCIFIAWKSILCLWKPCSCLKNIFIYAGSKVFLFFVSLAGHSAVVHLSVCLTTCLSPVYLSICAFGLKRCERAGINRRTKSINIAAKNPRKSQAGSNPPICLSSFTRGRMKIWKISIFLTDWLIVSCLSVSLSSCLSVCLSCWSVYLSTFLAVYLSVC